PDELRTRLPGGDEAIAGLIAGLDDVALARAIRNLGRRDLVALDLGFLTIADDRPTVILAYTIKGYGLPVEGHPQNLSALITEEQIAELAASLGTDPGQRWSRVAENSAAARVCEQTARRLRRPAIPGHAPPE